MTTVAWSLILVALVIINGASRGRGLTDIPKDLGDAFTAFVTGDSAALKETVTRSQSVSPIAPAVTEQTAPTGFYGGETSLGVNAFVRKYNNTYVNADSSYPNQCVDLVQAYMREVDGVTNPVSANAKDYWNNPRVEQHYQQITAGLALAQPGDIAVFNGKPSNPPGHIAIVLRDNMSSLTVFHQNYPKGSKSIVATIPKTNLLGYLRKKGSNIVPKS